jgi:hypothetical protein
MTVFLALLVAAVGVSRAATLYGAAYAGADGLATLYRIDPATGAAAAIGPIGFERVSGMDFGSDGRLYGAGERADGTNTPVLIVIDTGTGAGTEIGPLGLAAGQHVTDLSFRASDNQLYAYLDGPDRVATVDHATGAATIIGAAGPTGGGNGIAFDPTNRLLLAEFTGLYVLNHTTGAGTLIAALTFLGFPPPLTTWSRRPWPTSMPSRGSRSAAASVCTLLARLPAAARSPVRSSASTRSRGPRHPSGRSDSIRWAASTSTRLPGFSTAWACDRSAASRCSCGSIRRPASARRSARW